MSHMCIMRVMHPCPHHMCALPDNMAKGWPNHRAHGALQAITATTACAISVIRSRRALQVFALLYPTGRPVPEVW
jgi:hypothetical protein